MKPALSYHWPCCRAVQVHTGNRRTSAGFIWVHVTNGPPPSLGFPWTGSISCFWNTFFPPSTSEKVEHYSSGSSCMCRRVGSVCQHTQEFTRFCVICLFVYSWRELCKCCNSVQSIDSLGSKHLYISVTVLQLIVCSKHDPAHHCRFYSHLHQLLSFLENEKHEKKIFLIGGFFLFYRGPAAFKLVEMKPGQKTRWSLFEECLITEKNTWTSATSHRRANSAQLIGFIEDLKLGSIFYLHALCCFLFHSVVVVVGSVLCFSGFLWLVEKKRRN